VEHLLKGDLMKQIIFLFVLLMPVPVFAQSADADANATNQTSVGVGVDTNPVAIAAPVAVSGGSKSQSFSMLDLNNQITLEGSNVPPGTPGVLGTGGATPQLYTNPFQPGHVKGTGLVLQYIKQCKPVLTRDGGGGLEEARGGSRKTNIVFWKLPQAFPKKPSDDEEDNEEVEGQVQEVHQEFPESGFTGKCLGMMVVEGIIQKKQSKLVTILHVMDDAGQFALKIGGGYKKIYLVSLKDIIGYGVSVASTGRGFGFSPGVSGVNSAMDIVGSIVGGIGGNKGATSYSFNPGTTFVVFGEKGYGPTASITIPPPPHPDKNGKRAVEKEKIQ